MSRESKKAQLFAILSEVTEEGEEKDGTQFSGMKKKTDGCKPAPFMEKNPI